MDGRFIYVIKHKRKLYLQSAYKDHGKEKHHLYSS